MNIHEYQAKELLAEHGIAIPKGIPMEYLQQQGVGIGSLPSHSAPYVEELSEVESLPSMVLSDDEGDF